NSSKRAASCRGRSRKSRLSDMNFKTTYILFGVLGVVLLSFGLILWLGSEDTGSTAFLLPSANDKGKGKVETSDIVRVELERRDPAEKFLFVRDNKDAPWRMVEPGSFPVDRSAVEGLIEQVLRAKPDTRMKLDSDLRQYGLDTPSSTITLTAEDN